MSHPDHGYQPGPDGPSDAEMFESVEERGDTTTAILDIVTQTHADVTWLKRSLQALLEHYGIHIDEPRTRTARSPLT